MKRVYVAEDQRELADMLRLVLGGDPRYSIRIFNNGLEAYRAFREMPPDLLLIDILLPYLNGLAVTRLLKFHEAYRTIPVLVMSSITDPDIEKRVKSIGADSFIPKPFEVPRLLERVETLLNLTS